jgi:hypothetical protein
MPILEAGGFGTTAAATKVNEYITAKNRSKRRPRTAREQREFENGLNNPIFIYNTSAIFPWDRFQGQLGTLHIPARDWDKKFSEPAVVPGTVERWYRGGIGETETLFPEDGMEVALDICGMNPTYDAASPTKNLAHFGVFISKQPLELSQVVFDHLPAQRQRDLQKNKSLATEYVLSEEEATITIEESRAKLLHVLENKILEADNWYDSGEATRKFIHHGGGIHRLALREWNQLTGQKLTKAWSTMSMGETLTPCIFCGTQNKPNLAMCPNCHQVLDKEKFEKLKKTVGV